METEIKNFTKVWSLAILSAIYTYTLSKTFHIPPGFLRLFFILPIIYLFCILPLSLSTFHLGGPTIFYLVWLANFKLFLYSFNLGPLSTHPNMSLSHFISIALLPIKVKVNSQHNETNHKQGKVKHRSIRSILVFGVKMLAFAVVVKIYEFKQDLPKLAFLVNYCCHLYLGVEITLAITAALVQATLGLTLEPQFNEPYLTTSLQDFWGHRWNLIVSDILRLSIYNPVRRVVSLLVGRKWSLGCGMIGAFTVSGLMHEVIYYYFTRVRPTWEVTWFFVLHGVCTVVEVMVKEAIGKRFRMHRVISGVLTLGFVGVTAWWLFLPQILRNGVDVKVVDEYPVMVKFVKEYLLYLYSCVNQFWVVSH